MSSNIRLTISFLCALLVSCIVDIRLGNSPSIYTIAGAIPYAITAPALIPIISLHEQFQSRAVRESILRGETAEIYSEKGGGEGIFWGIVLTLAFYIPMFTLPRKDKRNEESDATTK